MCRGSQKKKKATSLDRDREERDRQRGRGRDKRSTVTENRVVQIGMPPQAGSYGACEVMPAASRTKRRTLVSVTPTMGTRFFHDIFWRTRHRHRQVVSHELLGKDIRYNMCCAFDALMATSLPKPRLVKCCGVSCLSDAPCLRVVIAMAVQSSTGFERIPQPIIHPEALAANFCSSHRFRPKDTRV